MGKLLVDACTHHGGTADARVILSVIGTVLKVVARSRLECQRLICAAVELRLVLLS